MTEQLAGIAAETVEILKKEGLTVSCAESCTGGMISSCITSVAGASSVFELGITSYSSRIKNAVLGVKSDTLSEYGAVSRQTAREMAVEVRKIAGSDIAVSVTGAAGPDPCEGKPVGTVYIALADGKDIRVEKLTIEPDSREAIRKTACSAVFAMICKCVENA